MGQLCRLRVDELAEEGSARLLDHSDDLLQLRVGVRPPRIRRQTVDDRPEGRGQPGPPRKPGAHLREGGRHPEPARRSGSDSVPAEARRRARRGPVGARVVGGGAHRDRGADPQRDRGRPPARADVPRRAARRRRLHEPRPAGLGHRRPQQPYERLLFVRAARALSLDGRRSAFARLRQRAHDPPPVVAPRNGPLFQSTRPADHGGAVRRRDDHHDRSPSLEHLREGEPLAAGLFRHRGRAAPGDRPHSPGGGSLRQGFRPVVGELGGLPSRDLSGRTGHLRTLHPGARGGVRAVHAGVRRAGDRRAGGADRRRGPRDRPRGQPFLHAQLARGGRRKPVGLANHALPLHARRPHRQRGFGRGRQPARHQQVRPEAPEPAAGARGTGTSCCFRANSRSRFTS